MFTAYELSDNEPPSPRQRKVEAVLLALFLAFCLTMAVLTFTGVVR